MEMRVRIVALLCLSCFLVIASLCADESVSQSRFRSEMSRIEQQVGGRIGVAALNVGTGELISYRSDERFAMCSTFKVLLVAAVLSMADADPDLLARKISFDAADLLEYAPVVTGRLSEGALSVEELCSAAVSMSDNTAANLLIELVGGPNGVTQFARLLGDYETRLDRIEPELNSNIPGDSRDTTTPIAMVHSLHAVLIDDALSESSRQTLIGWLESSPVGRARIRAGVGRDSRAATKSGSGERGATNDVGVVWTPDGVPVVLAIYSTGSRRPRLDRDATVAQIARISFETLLTP